MFSPFHGERVYHVKNYVLAPTGEVVNELCEILVGLKQFRKTKSVINSQLLLTCFIHACQFPTAGRFQILVLLNQIEN